MITKQIGALSFLIFFCISVPGYANERGGKNANNSAALAGGRQGQAVGFADADGDGNEDFAVGAINGGGPDVSLSGKRVRHMVTIAPVGGATDPSSRMSCSMHHAPMGSRGGAMGNGKENA